MRIVLTLSCLAASSSVVSLAVAETEPAASGAAATPTSAAVPAASAEPPGVQSSEPEASAPASDVAGTGSEPANDAPPAPEASPADTAPEPAPPAAKPEPSAIELEPASEPKPSAEPEPRQRASRRGLYLRFATGFGGYSEFLRSEESPIYGDGRVLGQSIGIASLGEFALGGSLAPGFVLGGGIYGADLLASTFRVDKDSPALPPTELDPELRSLALIGPFIDWYPKRGASDLHLQTALGLAALVSSRSLEGDRDLKDGYAAYGLGLMLGAGNEWHLGGDWSLGLLGRVLLTFTSGEDAEGVRWGHFSSTSLGLLASLTYY